VAALEKLGVEKALTEEAAQETTIPCMLFSEILDFDNENPAYYQDLIHLSTEGRTEYTKLLCEALKEVTP